MPHTLKTLKPSFDLAGHLKVPPSLFDKTGIPSSHATTILKQQSSQASVSNPSNLPIPIGFFLATTRSDQSLLPHFVSSFEKRPASKLEICQCRACLFSELLCIDLQVRNTMEFSQTAAPGTGTSFSCKPSATRLLFLLFVTAHFLALASATGVIETKPDLDSVDAGAEKPQAADFLMPNGEEEPLADAAYRPASRRSRFLSASAPSGIARAVPRAQESFRRVPATCTAVPGLCSSSFYKQAGATSCCGGQCCNIRFHDSHCGRCGKKCGFSSTCCNGECVQLKKDVHNCGRCGNKCQGKHPVCSYGMCNYNGRHW